MSISDDFIAALKALIGNVAAYRDALGRAGQPDDATAVGHAHGELLMTFNQANTDALRQQLEDLAKNPASNLSQITSDMAAKTAALNNQEATVRWVVGLAGAVIGLISAPSVTTAMALWTQLNAKPS